VKLLRDRYFVPAKGIHKIKGRPFFVDELKEEIRRAIETDSQ
jgi:2-oxoglutarate/2-oxoacid ferredoxin oxidoreductase subunit alpha